VKKIANRRGIPAWLRGGLRALPGARRLVHWWVKGRDVRISTGIGTGLRLNAASSNPAYALGTNELPVQQVLSDYLSPGTVFYDIGANIGFFSVAAARLVGEEGQVYAFEPLPENAAVIRRNIKINGFENIQVIEAAVADRSGAAEFLVAHYSGGSALASASVPPDLKEIITVEIVALDDLIARGQIRLPNLVKIDVEGAELQVIKGMSATLSQHCPILVFEIDDSDPEAFQKKQAACTDYLAVFGYSVTQLEESYPGIHWKVGNYLALPPGSPVH
jgi:FkbM family methyltransferase